MVYYVKDIPFSQPILCGVKEELEQKTGAGGRINTNTVPAIASLRNYRLGRCGYRRIHCLGRRYSTQALTYIGTLVNDVTAIYERDAGITFTLVTNNSIIFTDATTDPYPTERISQWHYTDNKPCHIELPL